jgi:hypothetical protein
VPILNKEKLLGMLRLKSVQAIVALVVGIVAVAFDMHSVESVGIRVLVGLCFGASLASLLLRDISDIWLTKAAAFGFAFFLILGYSIFTFFSATAEFSAWVVMVCVAIFLAYVMCRA